MFILASLLLAVFAFITFRGAVALVGGPFVDKDWDTSAAYIALLAITAAFPVRWMIFSGSALLLIAAPILFAVIAYVTTVLLYRLTPVRAIGVMTTHLVLASSIAGLAALAITAVSLLLLYARIITDPMAVLRWLLRLIGIEL